MNWLKGDKNGYFYNLCTRNDLFNILGYLQKDPPLNNELIILKNQLREIFKQLPLTENHKLSSYSDLDDINICRSNIPHNIWPITSDSSPVEDSSNVTIIINGKEKAKE